MDGKERVGANSGRQNAAYTTGKTLIEKSLPKKKTGREKRGKNMVSISIEDKHGFNIIGVKTWIPDTDNNLFGEFWEKCHTDGLIEQMSKFNANKEISVTKSAIIGFSYTEKDPDVRSFYFYIAVETKENENQENYEVLNVKPYKWAVFSSESNDINALMECEMCAWKEWLPNNETYIHDNGPEMEVYFQENRIEYWIPVREK